MLTRTGKLRFVAVVLALIVLCGCFACGYKVIKHEQNQSQRISNLEKQVSLLQAKLNATQVDWLDGGFNYLAIGNSITIHPYADYWWDDDRGMAASTDPKILQKVTLQHTLPHPPMSFSSDTEDRAS